MVCSRLVNTMMEILEYRHHDVGAVNFIAGRYVPAAQQKTISIAVSSVFDNMMTYREKCQTNEKKGGNLFSFMV